MPLDSAPHRREGLSQGLRAPGGDDAPSEQAGTLVAVIPQPARVLRAATVAALACLVAVGGCQRDDAVDSDAERFCGEAAANTSLIVDPPLASEAELGATLDFYRLMGHLAPLAIATEWNTIVAAYETASTVVPGDPDSEQRSLMSIYAAEPSAYAVKVWLQRNCGVDIPIVTIAPQAPIPARTLPPASAPGSTIPAGTAGP